MTSEGGNTKKLDWIDAVKALALLGILLNHIVEARGVYPWFTNPSANWPDLSTRLQTIFPDGKFFVDQFIYFMGWLGDNCVGVFIVISGLTLNMSSLRKAEFSYLEFYKKRLLRIFPLYVAIHLLVIAISLFIPGQTLDVGSPKMLLSLTGLRIGPLFYYVNPSWWFILLIMQLYVVFPLLYSVLQKINITWFLAGTILLTIGSRAAGIAGFHPINSLYAWMNGAFFGTRLAEFALGMVLGKWLAEGVSLPKQSRLFLISTALYLSGFAASLFWPTTVIHNLLISAGLTGIFYVGYHTVIKKYAHLNRFVLWLGVYSFSIYLIHQMGIIWGASISNEYLRFVVQLILVILLSLLGTRIEKNSKWLTLPRPELSKPICKFVFAGILFMVFILLAFLQPRVDNPYDIAVFHFGLAILMILFTGIFLSEKAPLLYRITAGATAITLFLSLFLLDSTLGKLAVAFLIITAIVAYILTLFRKYTPVQNTLGVVVILIVFVSITEVWSARNHPIEAKHWGEYPALEPHATRVYGLIPNKTTHLRYNNYDYIVKTNSMGMACPEAQIQPNDSALKVLITGDAFTMPEALEWEDSYTGLLQQRFNKEGKNITVINAGVTGYGPNEQVQQLKDLVPQLKPDFVFLQFFVNEFIEINTTREERLYNIGFNKDIDPGEDKPVHLFQLKKIYLQKFEYPLKGLVQNQFPSWYYEKCFMPLYEKENNFSYYADTTLHKLETALVKMDSICKNHGATFSIFYTPAQIEVSAPEDIAYFPFKVDSKEDKELQAQKVNFCDYMTNTPTSEAIKHSNTITSEAIQHYNLDKPYQHLKAICNKHNIKLGNLKPTLLNHPEQPVYYRDSWHWNKNGHKVVSEEVYRFLMSEN